MDNSIGPSYRGYRFPREVIGYCVWLYFRVSVSYRDVEELMAERGVTVTYEIIRAWCDKFGRDYARRIRARRGTLGDSWYLDDVLIEIEGQLHTFGVPLIRTAVSLISWYSPIATRRPLLDSSRDC